MAYTYNGIKPTVLKTDCLMEEMIHHIAHKPLETLFEVIS